MSRCPIPRLKDAPLGFALKGGTQEVENTTLKIYSVV